MAEVLHQPSSHLTKKEFIKAQHAELESNQFRLIELQPAEELEAPIQCQLKTYSFSSHPSYKALSYVWGAPSNSSEIIVNSSPFLIRPNLGAALRRIRRSDAAQILWVDAICISMDDSTERAQQISNMAKIYHSAREVLVWLGEEDASSRQAMAFISSLRNMTDSDDVLRGSRHNSDWEALCSLISRPWFTRRWIVAEVALAPQITVFCGASPLRWSELEAAISLLEARSGIYPVTVSLPGLGPRRLIVDVRSAFQRNDFGEFQKPLLSLRSLVTQLAPLGCSDPRDTIYALLGLAADVEDAYQWLAPDYSKSLVSIYTDFVKYFISTAESLDIIAMRWAPRDASYTCPSWVGIVEDSLDEHLSFVHLSARDFLRVSHRRKLRQYSASGVWKPRDWWRIEDDTQTLHVKGIRVDIVELVGNPNHAKQLSEKLRRPGFDEIVPESLWEALLEDSRDRRYSLEEPNPPEPSRSRTSSNRLGHRGNLSGNPPQELRPWLRDRALAVTRNRMMLGLVPEQSEAGDVVCILFGCSVPIILRPTARGAYKLVGECYIDGIMDGEAVRGLDAIASYQNMIITNERIASPILSYRHRQPPEMTSSPTPPALPGPVDTRRPSTYDNNSQLERPPEREDTQSAPSEFHWKQFRVHWQDHEGFHGEDTMTELRPGSVNEYAESLRKEGIIVTVQQIGLTDPLLANIRTLARNTKISFNNLNVSLRRVLLDVFGKCSSSLPLHNIPGQQATQGTGTQVAIQSSSRQPPIREDYLLLCINESRYLVSRNDLEISTIDSDEALFNAIRETYFSRQTLSARIFGFKSVQEITFVKFALHPENEVDCLQPNVLPPVTEKHYELDPWPPGRVPPAQKSFLMRRFLTPRVGCKSRWCLKQFPRRIERKPQPGVNPDMYTGWGLHFQEGYDLEKIFVLVLLGSVISLVFGVVWAAVRHSISDGFQVAGYVMATWAVWVTWLQFAFASA